MGQFLIVNGIEEDRVDRVFAAALRMFESLCRLKPSDRLRLGSVAVAKFPRLYAGGTDIVREKNTWICGAGNWLFDGSNGPVSLRTLCGRLQESKKTLASCLAPLEGTFALVFGEAAEDGFLLVTDRLGSFHVYSTSVSSCVVVSTSSLVLASLARPEWDTASLTEFLATGTVFERRTLFQGIEKLEPATIFRFHNGGLQSRSKYWDLAAVMYDRTSRRGDVPQLASALQDAFRALARGFRRPVADLTGGFDSRALIGAGLRTGSQFDTVVVGADSDPDVIAAGRIARDFRLRHRHQAPTPDWSRRWWSFAKASLPLCDGEYDLLEYARILDVHGRLAEKYDASINGSGGEICKGYWWELLFPFIGKRGHFDERLVAARRFALPSEAASLLDTETSRNLVEHFAGVISRANADFEDLPNTARMDNVYLTLRMQRWQGRITTATSRLWPCFSPFLFREPMEITLSTTPGMRLRHRMSRRLIEHLDPKLAALPLAQGYPALPMRLGTLHRFGPLVAEGAGRVAKHLLPSKKPSARANPLEGIWKEEEVREILRLPAMTTRDLYRIGDLERFLECSRSDGFANAPQFGRILTLELLSRTVRNCPIHS